MIAGTILLLMVSPALGLTGTKSVTLEAFDGNPLLHRWFALNDPVMGGLSTGTVTIQDGIGVFNGEVKDVPSLSAPGFIAMRTRGGYFPDLRSCEAIVLNVRSSNDYSGFRVSFGTNSASSMPYARGYKTKFTAPMGSFGDVVVPFSEFSDNWDPKTGDQIITCEDDNQFCPDDTTLADIQQFEIMAEGVSGDVNLEFKSIQAIGCSDDVQETDPNPNIGSGPNRPIENGGVRSGGSGFSGPPREADKVGGFGGYMHPSILENGDIRIESFDDPQHHWFTMNDPVMGGSSTSSVTVQSDAGILDGEVVDVSSLDAPGFISMETRGGNFPDVSMCRALKIKLRSTNNYNGVHIHFGTHRIESNPWYIKGYKTHLKDLRTGGEYQDIILPFTDFSDNWDANTGDILVSCAENKTYCPDVDTLKDFIAFGFMGEGVDGKVHLEVKSIDATDCVFDATYLNSSANNVIKTTGYYINNLAWVGIVGGAVMLGFVSFFVGRRHGKKAAFMHRPEVEVTSSVTNEIN